MFFHVLLWFYHKRKLIGCGILKLTEIVLDWRLARWMREYSKFRRARLQTVWMYSHVSDVFRDIFLSVTDVAWVDFITHQ